MSMADEPPPMIDRTHELLRSLLCTLTAVERLETAAYVVLSLGAALVGSLAAVLLVPLVQPGHALPLGGALFDARRGVDAQAVIFAVAMTAFALLRWQAARLGARLVGRYGMRLRQRVHARLIEAPLTSLADVTSAEIANVLTHNVELIVQGFSALQQLLVAGITAAVSLAFAFWVSPPLMLAAPLFAALGLLAARACGREQSRVSRQYVVDMTQLFWHSEDFPRRLRHVRSFGKEAAEKASYGAISTRLYQGYRRQLELVASGRLLLELLATAGIAGMFVLAHRWRGIDQSSLIAVCLLLGRLLPYLVSTRQSFQQLRSAAPAFELWQRYMHLQADRPPTAPARTAAGEGMALHIERMRWTPPSSGLTLADLTLAPGELTLVSGDSGIGKSSLVDVLAGMMRPEVFIARAGARLVDFDEYRERVRHGAYVSQSVRPWQHGVRECLQWAAPEASSEEMLRDALRDVGLDRRLGNAHHALDAALNSSSSRLSGGELQRLLLAQVILRRPFLALLDEATSALDAASEIAVLSTLKQRLPQTILIVVSHRPGVAAIADQVVTIGDDRLTTVARKASLRQAAFQP